jgi:phage protein D
MPLDAAAAVRAFRPTVTINGEAFPALSANIFRMRVREAAGGLASLELTLVDVVSFGDGTGGYGATGSAALRLGAEIRIGGGDTGEPQEIFQGVITGIECELGPNTSPLFTVLAEDFLWPARKVRKSFTHEQASPADIARRIAGDHGLTPEIRDGLDQPVSDWVQMNESDLAFLRRVLERFDADVQLVARRMQVGPCAVEPRSTVPLAGGSTLISARITADLADQATEVRVGSFDPATGEAVSAVATAGEVGPGEGPDGPSFLRPLVDPAREHVGHLGPMTESEAAAVARAYFGRRARRFVRVDGTAQGNPELRVGTKATITGVNPFFANDYTVVEATHRFDQETGYLTDFIAEGAHLGTGA